jgi:uncharacterized SAM-binding protein YcdF (DUF218 family)
MALSHDFNPFVDALLCPYTFFLLLVGIALVILWRKHRESRRMLLPAILPYLALMLISLPAVSHLAVGTLEWGYPPRARRPTDGQAIVVLSAGAVQPDAVRIRDELNANSVFRCLHAAEVYRQGPRLPVLVTGGLVDPPTIGRPDGDLMRDFLLRQAVKQEDLIVESAARSTYENALESRKLLEWRQIRKIILVTDAIHMPRAVRCFRTQGLAVTPSPCHHRATEFHWSAVAFLPNPEAVGSFVEAAHEWLGLAWYWLRGRI